MSSLNLTQNIANNSVIVVRAKSKTTLVSINSASLEQLDTLPGVGPALAHRIVAYRDRVPFKSLEELKNVKGIGDNMFLKLQDRITL